MSAAKMPKEVTVLGGVEQALRKTRLAFSAYQSASAEEMAAAREEWISALIEVEGRAMAMLPDELRHELEMLGQVRR
jgi:hypothetical protein